MKRKQRNSAGSFLKRTTLFSALAIAVAFAAVPAQANTDDHSAFSIPVVPVLPAVAPVCFTGFGTVACAAVGVGVVACYYLCDDLVGVILSKPHGNNARPSTKNAHENGQARQMRDQKRKEQRDKNNNNRKKNRKNKKKRNH